MSGFTPKFHTIILSDLHLSDAEPEDPKRPLWKKFRQKQYFIDQSFSDFIDHMEVKTNNSPIELILNGDIFDFDSVMSIPDKPSFNVSGHERKRGLKETEDKSAFKMRKILEDHDVFTKTLSEFVKNGNQLIFVIGNHDIELNWPLVQKTLIEMLKLPIALEANVRFCEWFYISQRDTLVEHGHQYDPYCLCQDPINPLIKKGKKYKVRLPFGNLANRYMVNGMGLKNPHNDENFIMSFLEFVHFFFKYEFKIQTFMALTWFEGAMRTLIQSITEGALPAQKDPLTFESKVKEIARKSNTTSQVVLTLKENHAHPAVRSPFLILRELWLDRAFLIMFIIMGCWQFFSTSYVFAGTSHWWFSLPLLISLPFFFYYAHGVQSDVSKNLDEAVKRIPSSAAASGVRRVVQGHTHRPKHFLIGDIEYYNTGTWSPLFIDPECSKVLNRKHFVWINQDRVAELHTWDDSQISKAESKNVKDEISSSK